MHTASSSLPHICKNGDSIILHNLYVNVNYTNKEKACRDLLAVAPVRKERERLLTLYEHIFINDNLKKLNEQREYLLEGCVAQ